ncbi:hypothetical protein BC830DRAFT_710484 [Chytriomyces sp. MP71]|nr:hypothetical protein BC830DRAFT_710484 [Chytriomyces sp. MP71]
MGRYKTSHPCEHCGKGFMRSEHLMRHIRCLHEKQKDFFCSVCRKYFGRRDELLRHLRMHARNGFISEDDVLTHLAQGDFSGAPTDAEVAVDPMEERRKKGQRESQLRRLDLRGHATASLVSPGGTGSPTSPKQEPELMNERTEIPVISTTCARSKMRISFLLN